MLQKVFSVVESEFLIQRPCQSHMEWIRLNEIDRILYLSEIMNRILMEREVVISNIVISPRLSSTNASQTVTPQKRSISNKMENKKSQKIYECAENLVNSMQSPLIKDNNGKDVLNNNQYGMFFC